VKVSVLNVQVPFVRGGAEYLADSFGEKIRERGHRVDHLRIPFKPYPTASILDHMLACRLLEPRTSEPDLVLALKCPAYLVPCEDKKVWLLHQHRQFYDLWDTSFRGCPDTPETHRVRAIVRAAYDRCLSEARALYTNSRIVADRLRKFNGIEADGIQYPPLLNPRLFRCGEPGVYVFYPSRLCVMKRQHVTIEAMRHVRSGFRLVLAGEADESSYQPHVEELIFRHRLERTG
jgi:glycosyltransferase involved in cell wall biosynthesis